MNWSRRVFFFLLLPLIICLIGVGTSFWLGDALPMEQIVNRQIAGDESILYRPLTEEDIFRYKLQYVNIQQPEVMVVGSSVANYFQADWFHDPSQFVNASIFGANIDDLIIALDQIPAEAFPQVVILPLPPNHLGSNRYFRTPPKFDPPPEPLPYTEHLAQTLRNQFRYLVYGRAFSTIIENKFQTQALQPIGVIAVQRNQGWVRGAGGIEAGFVQQPWETHQATRDEHLQLGRERLDVVRSLTDVEQKVMVTLAATKFDAIINIIERNNAKVIFVITPTFPEFYEQLNSDAHASTYGKILADLTQRSTSDTVALADYSDIETVGGYVYEMRDEVHIEQSLTLKVLRTLVDDFPTLLGSFTSIAHLDAQLHPFQHPYDLAGNFASDANIRDFLFASATWHIEREEYGTAEDVLSAILAVFPDDNDATELYNQVANES